MALNRADLRLALTAGLANGFTTLVTVPFGIYMPLAVLAVCTGTYGQSRSLGRQRLLGSVLGGVVLVLVNRGLSGLPFPLTIAIALGLVRLLGGLLGLTVGYKVGGIIVVMGCLVHAEQFASWIPLRLFWTTAGILVAMASLRLFWPARALPMAYGRLRGLLSALADQLDHLAAAVCGQAPSAPSGPPGPSPRQQLLAVRQLLPQALIELGGDPSRHPQALLLRGLLDACSQLVGACDGLERLLPRQGGQAGLSPLGAGEADLLHALADRLRLWVIQLHDEHAHPLASPPPQPWALPQLWMIQRDQLLQVQLPDQDLQLLRRQASRLGLCSLAERAVLSGERRWAALLERNAGPGE